MLVVAIEEKGRRSCNCHLVRWSWMSGSLILTSWSTGSREKEDTQQQQGTTETGEEDAAATRGK